MARTERYDLLKEALQPTVGQQQKITYDREVRGLGVRITRAGARSWIFAYSTKTGLARRMTIGAVDAWPIALAREEARRLRRLVDVGEDPLAERNERREALSVEALIKRWRDEAAPKLRPVSVVEDEGMIRQWVMPALGDKKIAEVKRADIEALHRKITKAGTPARANRVVSLVSRLFNLAVRWELRVDNPAGRIERNLEEKRYRFLDAAEMGRLLAALPAMHNQQSADIIRLLLLTGARRGEVLGMRWDQLDLANSTWTKPAAATKQKRLHHVPLSGVAQQILIGIKTAAEAKATKFNRPISAWVFPAAPQRRLPDRRRADLPITDIKTAWHGLCRRAGLDNLHLHDLRHAFATYLASSGANLPLIGQLLGHTQAATTQRYSHLLLDPQREATERVAAWITGIETGQSGEVVTLRRPRGGK